MLCCRGGLGRPERGSLLEIESRLYLSPDKHQAIHAGRPWVYRGEIARLQTPTDIKAGDLIAVCDSTGRFLGTAFYHPDSVLAARMLSRDPGEAIDRDFFARRISAAWSYRQRVLDDSETCRVIFAEADGLPGLIVDRLGDVLVLQVTVAGMERRLPLICDVLTEVIGPLCLYERDAGPIRRREGLEERSGPLRGQPPAQVTVREGDVTLEVDLALGQKTGHFLDQRLNHVRFGDLCRRLLCLPGGPGVRVLDAFCHTGGFGLQALAAGAAEVAFLDSSAVALQLAERNAQRNGFTGFHILKDNAFDALRRMERSGEVFDAVVLDPPAFARTKSQLDGAYRGYKEVNLRALRLLRPGGLLVTSSCSQPVTTDMYVGLVRDAAADSGRHARLIEERGAPPDHPGLVAAEGSRYLQCLFVQMVD